MSAQHLQLFLDLNRALAVAGRRFDAELGAIHGIGLTDLQLLAALAEAPERRLRRIDLAARLGLTPSGVTWILRPLQKRRLVASEASQADARVTYAVLTDAGRRLVAEALPSARALAEELLDQRMERRELQTVAELIERLG